VLEPPSLEANSNTLLTMKPSQTEDSFLYALSSNNAWAGYKAHQNPNFFPKLASGQSPQIRKPSFLPLLPLPPPPPLHTYSPHVNL
jgi:hypothetical protein